MHSFVILGIWRCPHQSLLVYWRDPCTTQGQIKMRTRNYWIRPETAVSVIMINMFIALACARSLCIRIEGGINTFAFLYSSRRLINNIETLL